MKQSAGLLLHRTRNKEIEVLLVHPGGPFWAKKDVAAWSIPKGEFAEGEESLAAAKREFKEELGTEAPEGRVIELGSFKVSSSKIVYAWAVEADLDTKHVKSNVFEMEWPPKSGKNQEFPEVDKAEWFSLPMATLKIVKGQVPLIEKFASEIGAVVEKPTPVAETPKKNATPLTGGQTSLF